MPNGDRSRDRESGRVYSERPWARKLLEGKEGHNVIEKGHEKLHPFEKKTKMTEKGWSFYDLSEQEAAQLRDEVHEAMPSLKNSGLTLKQKVTMLRIRQKNRARKPRRAKTRRKVR
jgi:hypothetical protein